MENSNINNEEKKTNILSKTLKKVFSKDEGEFTAEKAWLCTTYGQSANLPTEERIANKQRDIVSTIKSKFRYNTGSYDSHSNYSSYRCVIDIEDDLAAHVDEVLEPFKKNGFRVINLSQKIDEIKEEHVYLISWKNIFANSEK